MNKIRKGDTVVVLSGKDKGRQGTVLDIDGEKITVENINKSKKHQKPTQSAAGPRPGRGGPAPGRHRRQADAAAHLEGGDLERGREEGGPRRHQAAQ
jgi:hypothetical protein